MGNSNSTPNQPQNTAKTQSAAADPNHPRTDSEAQAQLEKSGQAMDQQQSNKASTASFGGAPASKKGSGRASSITVYSRSRAGRRRSGYVFSPDGSTLTSEQIDNMTDEQYDMLMSDPELIVHEGGSKKGSSGAKNEAREVPSQATPLWPLGSNETATNEMAEAAAEGRAIAHPATFATDPRNNPSVQAVGDAIGGEPTAKASDKGDKTTSQATARTATQSASSAKAASNNPSNK